jgi:hypothetical protein
MRRQQTIADVLNMASQRVGVPAERLRCYEEENFEGPPGARRVRCVRACGPAQLASTRREAVHRCCR